LIVGKNLNVYELFSASFLGKKSNNKLFKLYDLTAIVIYLSELDDRSVSSMIWLS